MIITCPHCQTKYQVTYEAIGSAGRKVQCAHCNEAWQQKPIAPEEASTPAQKKAFEAIEEDALDDVMSSEEHAVAEEVKRRLAEEKALADAEHKAGQIASAKVDPALMRKRQKAFSQRQSAMAADLPLARLRRSVRWVGLLMLAAVLAIGYFGRVEVVSRFPAMAGAYAAIGLGVNVVGLEFSNVTTLRTLRDGKEVLLVSAQIVGVMAEPVPVPSVVVTLIDAKGQGLYEWSVTPAVRDLMAGERSTFDTQLTLPPGAATRVKLSFAGGESTLLDGQSEGIAEAAPAADTSEPAAPAEADHGAPSAPTEHSSGEHH